MTDTDRTTRAKRALKLATDTERLVPEGAATAGNVIISAEALKTLARDVLELEAECSRLRDRLRTECEVLRQQRDYDYRNALDGFAGLNAEIDWLESVLTAGREMYERALRGEALSDMFFDGAKQIEANLCNTIEQQRTEIERLRDIIDAFQEHNNGAQPPVKTLELADKNDALRARIAELTALVRDATDRLERIEGVEDVSLVEEGQLTPSDLRRRSEELKALEDGWLDGEQGRPLDAAALQTLTDLLADLHEQEEVPVPYLYPTPSGDVQAEWTTGSWELSARFKLASGDVELDAVDAQTGAGKEEQASTKTPEGRLALVKFIKSAGVWSVTVSELERRQIVVDTEGRTDPWARFETWTEWAERARAALSAAERDAQPTTSRTSATSSSSGATIGGPSFPSERS